MCHKVTICPGIYFQTIWLYAVWAYMAFYHYVSCEIRMHGPWFNIYGIVTLYTSMLKPSMNAMIWYLWYCNLYQFGQAQYECHDSITMILWLISVWQSLVWMLNFIVFMRLFHELVRHLSLHIFLFWITYNDKTMMTAWNENIFCITGPLCGEFTIHRWIPLTKASDTELWCFLLSAPE